ncbi:MAG: hypothetical protein Q8L29_02605 [archaeon]|nr:hypothetical protein [archaeon]
MKNIKFLVSLAAVLVLSLVLVNSASAFADISGIEVNGVSVNPDGSDVNIGAFAGQTLPVRVTFVATANSDDARVKVWLAGEKENQVSSERFKVLNGSTYSNVVLVQIPSNIDPSESMTIEALVESKSDGIADSTSVSITAQRLSYSIEVLDANLPVKVRSGDAIPLDIVLKNRGSQFAEDTFVTVKISSLGLEQRAYFGDLSATDQNSPAEKEDAVERRMLFNIPRSTPSGVYTIEVNAFNADSDATVSKKFAVVGASEDTTVVASSQSKNFGVGETAEYSLTLVNAGNKVAVYSLASTSDKDLSVSFEEPIVAVPAGTSRTVKATVEAEKAGSYSFTVGVYSNSELVQEQTFNANVAKEGFSGNATVLLTVILAIIFIVLLVVLIVLLTRKPEKTEEFGESYY